MKVWILMYHPAESYREHDDYDEILCVYANESKGKEEVDRLNQEKMDDNDYTSEEAFNDAIIYGEVGYYSLTEYEAIE